LEKVVAEMKSRISARTHKENQRRKTALEASSLPAKLYDCRDNGVENTELFIVEGDSAMGTAKAARNSDHQALFPIRGKILNVQKATLADMLANVECSALIQVIGAGSGRSFDLGIGPVRTSDHHDRMPTSTGRTSALCCSHPLLPVHEAAGPAGAGLRSRAAAAPGRGRHEARHPRMTSSTPIRRLSCMLC
jgi:hypothetical protein